MPPSKQRVSVYETARRILEEATSTALGPACNTVITFHLKQKFEKDPYQVFVEDPGDYYAALEKLFGAGAKSFISLVGTFLINKYGMTYSAEEFVNLVVQGDKSSKNKLGKILSHIAEETVS